MRGRETYLNVVALISLLVQPETNNGKKENGLLVQDNGKSKREECKD